MALHGQIFAYALLKRLQYFTRSLEHGAGRLTFKSLNCNVTLRPSRYLTAMCCHKRRAFLCHWEHPATAISVLLQVMIGANLGLTQPSDDQSIVAPTAQNETEVDQTQQKIADPTSAERPPTGSLTPRPAVQQIGPDTFFFLGEDGNREYMLGMSYEDFFAVWKQMQLPDQASTKDPVYTIDEILIDGMVRDSHAELSVKIRISLLTEVPISVPLRMSRAILQGQPDTTETDSTQHLYFDESQGGYVVRIQGKADTQVDVQVGILVPLKAAGSETLMRLNCRRAAVSKLILNLNSPIESADTHQDAVLTIERDERGKTRLIAERFGGEWELRWRANEALRRDLPSVLSSSGSILAEIDGRSVRADAWLTIQSSTGRFDDCFVQLPTGAVLVNADEGKSSSSQRPYAVDFLPTGTIPPGAKVGGGPWVHIRCHGDQNGPVQVHLRTETPFDTAEDALAANLGGFDVHGAVRQYGDLGIVVADDWQLRWSEGANLRQVNTAAVDQRLVKPNVRATFQYDRQPWSLPVRVARRKTQMLVTPNYQLDLLRDEARLRLELDYYIPDARVFEFRVRMRGWEITAPVESGGLIETDVQIDQDELVLILRDASPRSAKLVVQARRDIDPETDRFDFSLPAAVADVVSPGELHVVVAPGLAVTADDDTMVGLTPEPIAAAKREDAASFGQQQLTFRSFHPEPYFSASRSIPAQRIDTVIDTEIRIVGHHAEVDQLIEYLVHHHPVDRLTFRLPTELMNDDSVIRLEKLVSRDRGSAEEIQGNDIVALEPANVTTATRGEQLQVQLPTPQLGPIYIRARHHISVSADSQADNLRVDVPLFVPLDGVLNRHRLSAQAALLMSIALANDQKDEVWNVEPMESNAIERTLRTVAFSSTDSISLELGTAVHPDSQSTFIDRAWMQTLLSADGRLDRVVYQFRTNEPTAFVELPRSNSLNVTLDGHQVRIVRDSAGPIPISVGDSSLEEEHTLEITYRISEEASLFHRLKITPPRLVASWAAHQAHWHVVLPGDSYILSVPPSLSRDGQAGWQRFFGKRDAVWTQQDLEERVGASTPLSPAVSENVYVFASLAPLSSVELITARRWIIVLCASAIALLIGLVVVYTLRIGTAGTLTAFGGLLAVLAIAFPDTALFFGQAAALGVLLTLFAAFLRRSAVSRSARYRQSTSGSSASFVHRPSTSDSLTPTPIAGLSLGRSSVPTRVSDLDP